MEYYEIFTNLVKRGILTVADVEWMLEDLREYREINNLTSPRDHYDAFDGWAKGMGIDYEDKWLELVC